MTAFDRMRSAYALAAVMMLALIGVARADRINGEASVTTDGGYARLVIKLEEEVEAKVSTSGTVLIIAFKKPVSIAVEQINSRAPDYFSAARQDPDGSAIRIALAKKVKINTINAAERLYVDLMPENWVGLAPGLPQDVIDELARRTREAERLLRKQQLTEKPKISAVIRVKVGVQPTFVRYLFELPELANVAPERSPEKLTLNFDQPLRFDLADAKATLPKSLDRIDTEQDRDSASVIFRLKGKPLVRSYQDGRSLIIDVSISDAEKTTKESSPAIEPPETIPANSDVKSGGEKHGAAQPTIAPPATEPETAAKVEAAAPTAVQEPKAGIAMPASPPAAPPSTALSTKEKAETQVAETTAPPLPADALSPDKRPPVADPEVASAPQLPVDPNAPLAAVVHQQGANLRVDFPFVAPTPAAIFRRGRTMWLVFDSGAKIDTSALKDNKLIRQVSVDQGPEGDATILRLALDQPKLASFFSEGSGWVVVIGDAVVEPTKPVAIARSVVGKGRASITIPFAEPRKLHHLTDPEVGDKLLVVTALGPARGFLKGQDFVELRALGSIHGVVVQPLADDLTAELAADKIVISRPGGLSLSSSSLATRDNNSSVSFQPLVFDPQTWGFDRQAKFDDRQAELIGRAAAAPDAKRRAARLDLARFYLARDLAAEAKGVLDVATADERDGENVTGAVLKAVADVMLRRPEEALKELANPKIGNNADAPIWRAMAHALQGRWAQAREEFGKVESAIGALPIELQRTAKLEMLRCSIEVRDYAGASVLLNDFETLGVPPEMTPSLQVLTGRLEEGLGHNSDALAAYRLAVASRDRRYATQAQLRDMVLRHKLGDLKDKEIVAQLEELTTAWRGDETEAEGLRLLAPLYTKDKRYRDAFHVMRTALLAHPNSDLTRKIQDEAATTFDALFMTGEGDAMPPIEALGLFYDYRELTPIGRRGDEMIRRLADRLVAVDLLEQAAELLQHQVDHRLKGAARAQVAARLATVYLMNRKPDRALAAIEKTRLSELAGDLREQRLLLEARAMSDIGRHELALEVIEGMKGPQVLRLRADVLWSAKKWRDAAEAIELLYGQRWKDDAPLNDQERSDVLRGAIAYALAEDPIGLRRYREKYLPKMSDGPDRRAFEVVSAPIGTTSREFRAVAGVVGNVSTLDAFLADMRKRFPEKDLAGAPEASAPETKPAQSETRADNPVAAGKEAKDAKSALPAKPTASTAGKVDRTPTGSIGRSPNR